MLFFVDFQILMGSRFQEGTDSMNKSQIDTFPVDSWNESYMLFMLSSGLDRKAVVADAIITAMPPEPLQNLQLNNLWRKQFQELCIFGCGF